MSIDYFVFRNISEKNVIYNGINMQATTSISMKKVKIARFISVQTK